MAGSISKQELKYLIYIMIFALIWFLVIIPYLLDYGIESKNIYLQFIIFNLGIFFFLQIFLKSRTLKSSINLRTTFGLIFLIMAVDCLIPPFLVTSQGELLDSVVLRSAGTDYVLGHLAINSFGLSGMVVFIFVYIIAPAVLLLISAHLLPNMVKNL